MNAQTFTEAFRRLLDELDGDLTIEDLAAVRGALQAGDTLVLARVVGRDVDEGERLMNVEEACDFAGRPRRVIWRWARRRPSWAIWDPESPRTLRILRAVFIRWLLRTRDSRLTSRASGTSGHERARKSVEQVAAHGPDARIRVRSNRW